MPTGESEHGDTINEKNKQKSIGAMQKDGGKKKRKWGDGQNKSDDGEVKCCRWD